MEIKLSLRALDVMEEWGEGICLSCGESAIGIQPLDQEMRCNTCGCLTVVGTDIIRFSSELQLEDE